MRPLRLVALVVVVLLALALVPAAALAADPVTISGTVVRDGSPVTGVQVVVSVTGSDQIVAATTDEQGAFSVQVDAVPGSDVRIEATGQTSRSDPDSANCVHLETPSGTLTFTIQALPVDPVVVTMDQVITGLVCGPTPTPRVTPPSTDVASPPAGHAAETGLLVALGVMSLMIGASLSFARRWR
jgi:hypothetical protein